MRVADLFSARGGGPLRFEAIHAGLGSLEASDWVEANTSDSSLRPSCHFTTGLLANLLGRAAGEDLGVLEVECRSEAEIDEALAAGATRLLLDNFTPGALRAAVARVGGRAELEASGGISIDSLRDFAETGVHWISIGALTHSAAALDLSLTLENLPQ